MKKIIKIGIPIVSIFLLIACGNSENKKQENPQDSEASASIPKDNAIRIDDDVLNAIYSQYVHLTVALTQDNLAEAKLAANAIEAGASEINNSNLAAFAAAIVSAPDIDKQRAAYSKLSNEMVGLLKKQEWPRLSYTWNIVQWLSTIKGPYGLVLPKKCVILTLEKKCSTVVR